MTTQTRNETTFQNLATEALNLETDAGDNNVIVRQTFVYTPINFTEWKANDLPNEVLIIGVTTSLSPTVDQHAHQECISKTITSQLDPHIKPVVELANSKTSAS